MKIVMKADCSCPAKMHGIRCSWELPHGRILILHLKRNMFQRLKPEITPCKSVIVCGWILLSSRKWRRRLQTHRWNLKLTDTAMSVLSCCVFWLRNLRECRWMPTCNVNFMNRWDWNVQDTFLCAAFRNRKLYLLLSTASCVRLPFRDLCTMRLPLSREAFREMPDCSRMHVKWHRFIRCCWTVVSWTDSVI